MDFARAVEIAGSAEVLALVAVLLAALRRRRPARLDLARGERAPREAAREAA